jgi:hypothetical protein
VTHHIRILRIFGNSSENCEWISERNPFSETYKTVEKALIVLLHFESPEEYQERASALERFSKT